MKYTDVTLENHRVDTRLRGAQTSRVGGSGDERLDGVGDLTMTALADRRDRGVLAQVRVPADEPLSSDVIASAAHKRVH